MKIEIEVANVQILQYFMKFKLNISTADTKNKLF